MKILHTSDWHLGHTLMTRDRKQEHGKFIEWLIRTLSREKVDALIIAGDIFDTGTPPNYALEIYYRFLARVRDTGCGQVVVVGGNHDSVATLHAPRTLLKTFDVSVTGCASKNPDDQLVVVKNQGGEPLGIICAVPFLRDRDVRRAFAGESYEEKGRALVDGIKNHYVDMATRACDLRATLSTGPLPVVATGHLFAAGAKSSDGVRDIYVGNLGQIGSDAFPDIFDYVALGHLHRPQKVGGCDHIRYSGSPIPLSFGEAENEKHVVIVDIEGAGDSASVKTIPIPNFQPLCQIKGDLETIENKIDGLIMPEDGEKIWLEVHYNGKLWEGDLNQKIGQMVEDKPILLFAVRNVNGLRSRIQSPQVETEHLAELKVEDVFQRRLNASTVSHEDEKQLVQAFNEIVNSIHTKDRP